MHKRIAICLNSISHLMEDPDDEILFVDCNTRDDLPTVAESIADTLTEKTKAHLRIFRLRPALFLKYSQGSKLPVSESLSKNIAIRRSNERNRWFLTTTSDIVVIPRKRGQSLSEMVSSLDDGFYELPRFGVPEALWETLSRRDPDEILSNIREWGNRFFLNNISLVDRPDILFDAPGDFQLCLRKQLFEICGFDERMVHCWHQDSNLAKRLYLLNGETKSLVDHAYCYHCDHTWEVDYLHRGVHERLLINDEDHFVFDIKTPFALHQEQSWGLIHEEIEEIHLNRQYQRAVLFHLSRVIPDSHEGDSKNYYSRISMNSSLHYDINSVFPFILNAVEYMGTLKILYLGGHCGLVHAFEKISNDLKIDYFVELESAESAPRDKGRYRETFGRRNGLDILEKIRNINLVLVDLLYTGDFIEYEGGVLKPVEDESFDRYKTDLTEKMEFFVLVESERIDKGLPPAKFVFIGLHNTWAEAIFSQHFNLAHTQYASHVTFGSLRYYQEKKKNDLEEDVRILESKLKDSEKKLKDSENRLNQLITLLSEELRSIYSSRSWKFVSILRKIAGFVR